MLLLMKILQTKSHVKNMNFIYYDLFYTLFRNRDERRIVNDQYENNEKDYINYDYFITPN